MNTYGKAWCKSSAQGEPRGTSNNGSTVGFDMSEG
jgi:hypothetical protein